MGPTPALGGVGDGHANSGRAPSWFRPRPAPSSGDEAHRDPEDEPPVPRAEAAHAHHPHPQDERGLAGDSGFTSRPLTATIDSGTVTTQLTVTLDQGVRVQLGDLGIKALPLDRVLVDFLCQGYAITGPLDLTGGAQLRGGRSAQHAVWGPGQLRAGPGQGGGRAGRWRSSATSCAWVGPICDDPLGVDLPALRVRVAARVPLDHRDVHAHQRASPSRATCSTRAAP